MSTSANIFFPNQTTLLFKYLFSGIHFKYFHENADNNRHAKFFTLMPIATGTQRKINKYI
jgi:hypothetical protein